MPKNPLPGEAFLRAVVHVAKAGNDWPLALTDAVGILRSRVNDVRNQREAIQHLPEWPRDSLNQRLRALEHTCSDFAETLDGFLVDAEPDPLNYPPNALLVSVAATIVARELELAVTRFGTGTECD